MYAYARLSTLCLCERGLAPPLYESSPDFIGGGGGGGVGQNHA